MKPNRFSFVLLLLLAICCQGLAGSVTPADAFWWSSKKVAQEAIEQALKHANVSPRQVRKLARLHNAGEITKAISRYPGETRKAILLAVARDRKIMSGMEADELYRNIRMVDGFENVAKLLCAANKPNVKGALYELRTANAAQKRGFKVLKMRGEFYGGSNRRITDIDILLETRTGKKVALECKDYGGKVPGDMIASKLDKMLRYQRDHPDSELVFSFRNDPGALVTKLLEKRGVKVLVGDPDVQMRVLQLML